MASIVTWLCLLYVLCMSTFGFWFCTYVLMSIALTVTGFITVLWFNVKLQYGPNRNFQRCNWNPCMPCLGIPKVVAQVKHPAKPSKLDQRLTGSVKIDEHLQEIASYISRDYIDTWYGDISSNRDFIHHTQQLFKNVVNNISRNTIEVDWVSFFTRQLVDDFASHIRLYRQSDKALRQAQKEQSEKYPDFESAFFDFELAMEKTLCRDLVCTSQETEKEFLKCLSDMLLYLLLPKEDYKCSILRFFLRDVLSSAVLLPTVSLLADPDYINQNLIWVCKDTPISKRSFLNVIRRTDSLDELTAVMEIAKHEIKVHKSKDTSAKSDVQKHVESINFVYNLASQRHKKLLNNNTAGETDSVDLLVDTDITSDYEKLIRLPFDIVLNNNIGLYYFQEFLTSVDAQGYVLFYHSIEGYRATAESVLSDEDVSNPVSEEKMEKLRDFAMHIFETYFGENAVSRVVLDETLIKKLHSRLKTERLSENFFDELQSKVYDIMKEEYFATDFKESSYYVKLLAELDLLPDLTNQDEGDVSSNKFDACDESEKLPPSEGEVDSSADQDIVITELLGNEVPNSEFCFPENSSVIDYEQDKGEGTLTAEIYSTGITHHAGKTFAVYAIAVSHQRADGAEQKWYVVRRYSEFHDFHKAVNEKFPELSSFDFPSKKAFNNLSRHLMEKRRRMLNEYLQFLLCAEVLCKYDGLQVMLYNFLEPRSCGSQKRSLVRTVGTIVSPIKTSVKTVGTVMKIVPNTLYGLKDGLVRALSRNTNQNSDLFGFEMDKVSAGLDLEADDIPLRIMLLLIDEIFDLKSKDQWFRKRIMILLRQIIRTTQGDTINRKLTDYVDNMISVMQVAECLKLLSRTLWPNGILAEPQQERDNNTIQRTRVMAKTLLLSCIPDELKHVIGNETSYRGVITVFNMLQRPSLNRRLVYALFESFLSVLFPENSINDMLEKLHSNSPRTSPITPIKEEHFADEKPVPDVKHEAAKKKSSVDSCSSVSSKNKDSRKLSDFGSSNNSKSQSSISSLNSGSDRTPKLSRKSKKCLPTAVFYTDSDNSEPADDDMVVLSLPSSSS